MSHTITQRFALLCLAGFAGGCGMDSDSESRESLDPGAGAAEPVTDICGGGTDKLRVALGRGSPGQWETTPLPARSVASSSLLVDDSCRFWVGGPRPGLSAGTLDAMAEQMLIDTLRLDEWAALAGEYAQTNVSEVGHDLLRFDETQIACRQCDEGGGPAEVQELIEAASAAAAALRPMATPLTGAVAVQVNAAGEAVGDSALWDLETPIATAVDAAELVLAGADADAIRSLWESDLDPGGVGVGPHVPMQDADGNGYRVYVRDVLALEEDGQVEFFTP